MRLVHHFVVQEFFQQADHVYARRLGDVQPHRLLRDVMWSHTGVQTALCGDFNVALKFLGIFGLRRFAFNPENPYMSESFKHSRAGRVRFSWLLSVRVLEQSSCQRKEQTHISRVRICLFTLSLPSNLFFCYLSFSFLCYMLFSVRTDSYSVMSNLRSSCVLVFIIHTHFTENLQGVRKCEQYEMKITKANLYVFEN